MELILINLQTNYHALLNIYVLLILNTLIVVWKDIR